MHLTPKQILVAGTTLKPPEDTVYGGYVTLLGELYYKIENFTGLEPFFMTLVSGSDHWLFISSNGGLTAGRGNADQALFPYYTEDKLTDNSETTGSKTIFLVSRGDQTSLWEPLSERQQGLYAIKRSLYKNISGTALIFEEHNLAFGLIYRYAWRTSERFGFVKTSWLANTQEAECSVELLDGLQNLLPANITEQTQTTFSNLLDAYKKNEVDPRTSLAIYALNSRLTDKAEPSESLLATTVAQVGLSGAKYLLSSRQLDRFRMGEEVSSESEMRGWRGAYFAIATIQLAANQEFTWHLVADVMQDSVAIARLSQQLQGDQDGLVRELENDIAEGQSNLWKMVANADGLQLTRDRLATSNHFANAMFNLMRGGIFADQYWIHRQDFIDFVSTRNQAVLQRHAEFFASLPPRLTISELQSQAGLAGEADLVRLSASFLPLVFSRRHGDPSRPWNRFSINLKKPDGTLKLDYQGNWRDIFQNWEALAYSYPEFVESMLSVFLNATTPDGYNPYRITLQGIEWEIPDPGNPWANIGYWSDHQVIYLQKLVELSARLHPGKLQQLIGKLVYSYANVPYRLKPYAGMLADPGNTIEFDGQLHKEIEARVLQRGTDARLVSSPGGGVLHACLAEKLLTIFLAKLVNLVPEGGIWMNTQRPEWNDANNALVGKGLSVVTLCSLRRSLAFCCEMFHESPDEVVPLHEPVHRFFTQMMGIMQQFKPALDGAFTDELRHRVMDAFGKAGEEYRSSVYSMGLSGRMVDTPVGEIAAFCDLMLQFVEHSLRANRRHDGMYHSYNILHLGNGRAAVSHLYEMLEGQAAVLSSGMLSAGESLELLLALRRSSLYQPDQHSYILYPDRSLPGFMQKNSLPDQQVKLIPLFAALIQSGDRSLVTQDINGTLHFNGQIRNIQDVNAALEALKSQPRYAAIVDGDRDRINELFEEIFHHDEFTGRSGTFFAYEGLGSVYWHMVAKLLLATQETLLRFKDEPSCQSLVERYWDIRQGLGFNKTPAEYGAFPTDPYSHTPKGRGAKQPGMTGMVKELILTRQVELGLIFDNGRLVFDGVLFDPQELLLEPAVFPYLDVEGRQQQINLEPGGLAYTVCQTPVVLQIKGRAEITVYFSGGTHQHIEGNSLDEDNSRHIFQRDGFIHHLVVGISTRQ